MGTVAINRPSTELLSPAQSARLGQQASPGKQRHWLELMAADMALWTK